MSWTMKRLYLISIALVLCGDTNGFPVVDWQAGQSNTFWNQNDQLYTPVQPSMLLAGRGANVNVGEGSSRGVWPTSVVQSAQPDTSFVRDVSVLYGQGGPTIQRQSTAHANLPYGSQSSGQSMANPVTAGQFAAAQSLGASYPSQMSGSYAAAVQGQMSASPSRVSGFQIQSSYQPSTTARVSEGQSVSTPLAQTSGASTLYDGLNSRAPLTSTGQTTLSSSQSSVPTSHLSGFQATVYQPSTATGVLTGQAAVAQDQFLGATYPSPSSGSHTVLQSQSSPSSSQVSGNQNQISNQPSFTTVLTGQSTTTTTRLQSVPSSSQSGVGTNQIYGSQTHSAYQPGTPPEISTGESFISQAPFSSRAASSENAKWYTFIHPQTIAASFPAIGSVNWLPGFQTQLSNQPSSASQIFTGQSTVASDAFQSQTSGRNTISQGQPSPPQLPGFQTQSSHQPSTSIWISAGRPASTAQAQSSGTSMLNQGLTSMGQTVPVSQSANQMSELQIPSLYQPSTATASLAASYPSQMSLQGQLMPSSNQVPVFQTQFSHQPSTATQVLTGQSASTSQTQSSAASISNQGLISGGYETALTQTIPSASQAAVPPLRQTYSYQPGTTQALARQSATLLQSSDAATVNDLQASSRYQSIPSAIQSVFGTNQMYGSQAQSVFRPSTPLQISTSQSPVSLTPFSSMAESSENANLYTVVQPRNTSASFLSVGSATPVSAFQTQSSNQPSSASLVLAGQSPIAQSLDASGPTSERNTILQGQLRPPQLPGLQAQSSHQPSTSTWISAGQPVSTSQAPSFGMYLLNPSLTSGMQLASMGQTAPASQSENEPSQLRATSLYQPSTATLVSADGFNVAQSPAASFPTQMSGRHAILPGQLRPSQLSGFPDQPSASIWISADQPASTSQSRSPGVKS